MVALQFDVFANPEPESAPLHPYVVVVQHGALGALSTRLVAPLISPTVSPSLGRLMPEVSIRGSRYLIDVTSIGVVPERMLQERVANLEDRRYDIVQAIDLVFTGV